MYDLFTVACLFYLMCPGVVVSLPPGAGIMTAAAIHAILFFLVLQYVSLYVPWYVIWIAAIALVFMMVYFGRTS